MKLDSKITNIWFTADTHYWHTNICKGVSIWKEPEKNCRDFATVQEMSRHIVEKINECVKENDILFHAGDWSFGGIDNIWNFRKQINCRNIHLITGNHDHHIKNNKKLIMCGKFKDNFIFNSMIYYQNLSIEQSKECEVFCKDLFSSVQNYLELQVDKTLVCINHFPFEVWEKDKFIHLFGHVHGKLPFKEKRLDVGLDSAYKLLGEYRPFNWEEIKKILL